MRRIAAYLCLLFGLCSVGLGMHRLSGNRQKEREIARSTALQVEALKLKIAESQTPEEADVPSGALLCPEEQDFLGVLEIPVIGIESPVANYPEALDDFPTVYSGSLQDGELIIAGHNYLGQFGPLKDLSPGDRLFLTDMTGIKYAYSVVKTELLFPWEGERLLDSGHDLTLYTCNIGAEKRIVVYCESAELSLEEKH